MDIVGLLNDVSPKKIPWVKYGTINGETNLLN